MRDEWRIKCNEVISDFVFFQHSHRRGAGMYVKKKSHFELPSYFLRMSGDFKDFLVCISVFCHQTAVCMDSKEAFE